MTVKLIWITPDAERLIAQIARVSNPSNQDNPNFKQLLMYMVKNAHWSPFEMASACFEINTTRDIGRQILRHRSFSFQEFSQRYADVSALPPVAFRECRLQDIENRQNSVPTTDEPTTDAWLDIQKHVYDTAVAHYKDALNMGVAKEQARALLPEGLTPSRLYMSGTIRSWMHYTELRSDVSTQKEHRVLSSAISEELKRHLPTVWSVLGEIM